jgi:5-methylcytosine-specific restriction endonuclease McrA
MISLCDNIDQRDHLTKLIKLVRTKQLNGGEAWSAFSSPSTTKYFDRKGVRWATIKFTKEEVKTYKTLREKAQKKIFERSIGCCAYCRRPVGHYGWAWHIEHVLPKSKRPALTFKLSNLTVGCVHCNQWKGARVDRAYKNGQLPIINPVSPGFIYSKHLTYVQISTESVCFAKYSTHSGPGIKTHDLLSFEELERSYAINGLHAPTAALHERLTRAMGAALTTAEGYELVKLLGSLKSSIYRLP